MKNEVKLNIHMFFLEMQNDEISAEQHKALETLLALPELDQEDSVEKFTSELTSRFELIKPILGDQTEEFLGYCQDDITKLSDFFAGRFVRFGMDAVTVQKILRNIWLQTPCEDKMLNYALYKFIDEKFYGIVNERKRTISFDHIPAPEDGSWETLKRDWEARRAHYAKELDIDIDYLDGEAVDGRIFPSASGLFANPVFANELEFLNFWMPHLLRSYENPNELTLVPSYIIDAKVREKMFTCCPDFFHSYRELFIGLTKVKMPAAGVERDYFDEKFYLNDYEIYESAISEHYESNHIDFSSREITIHNVAEILQETEQKWFEEVRQKFGNTQPACFFDVLQYPFRIPGEKISYRAKSWRKNGEYIKNPDNLQLPEFINSCHEYVLVNKQISKSKHLIFYNGQKIYIPDNFSCFDKWIEHAEAFKAAHITIPNYYDVQKIDEYYKQVYPLIVGYRYGGEAYNWTKDESLKYPNIFHFRLTQFVQCIAKLFDHYAQDENLSGIYKIQMLVAIKNNFANVYKECPDLNKHMAEVIEGLRKSEPSDLKIENFADNINNIYYLCEKEKLKLQLNEIKTRENILFEMSHHIKNLVASVSEPLIRLQENISDNKQLKIVKNAIAGTRLVRNIAMGVHYSMRGELGGWRKDVAVENAPSILDSIILEAIKYAVSNMFDGKYFEEFVRNYFNRDLNLFLKAQNAYGSAKSLDDIIKCLNLYFFDFRYTVNGNSNIGIGDSDGTATKLLILFQELFLNAVKYCSYTDREKRFISFHIDISDKTWKFIIKNSSMQRHVAKSSGLGLGIIQNFARLFEAEYNVDHLENTYQTTLIFYPKGE